MPPGNLDNLIPGPYTLRSGRLTFETKGAFGADARQAMASGRTLTVRLSTPAWVKEISGKVVSVELLDGTPPTTWPIEMKVPDR